MNNNYYIEWIYLSTKYKGRGDAVLSYNTGKEWVKYLNNKYKGMIEHTLKR